MERTRDRETFKRLANKRVPATLKAIDLIGNLSNRSNYSFTDDDAKAIIKALKTAVAECEARFAGKEIRQDAFRLE